MAEETFHHLRLQDHLEEVHITWDLTFHKIKHYTPPKFLGFNLLMLQTSILTTQRSLCLWPRGTDKQKIISDTWISNLWSEYCVLLISKRCSGLDNQRNMGVHMVGSLFWLRTGQVGRKNKCPSHSSPKPAVSSHSQMATVFVNKHLWIQPHLRGEPPNRREPPTSMPCHTLQQSLSVPV